MFQINSHVPKSNFYAIETQHIDQQLPDRMNENVHLNCLALMRSFNEPIGLSCHSFKSSLLLVYNIIVVNQKFRRI